MIAAVLLAAGRSTRMGEPKLLLPWRGEATLISQVVKRYLSAGVDEIFVVTGANREAVEAAIDPQQAHTIFNPRYAHEEMLSSLQVGLGAVETTPAAAALVSPADIPDVKSSTIRALIDRWRAEEADIVAPSYEFQRGHPILIASVLFPAILKLGPGDTLRSYLRRHESGIRHVEVDDAGILRDVDTPKDYRRQ